MSTSATPAEEQINRCDYCADLKSKVENQKIFFAVFAAVLCLVGAATSGAAALEAESLAIAQQDLAIAQQDLSSATALWKKEKAASDIQIKDLQTKMAKMETTPAYTKRQKKKTQEVKVQSETSHEDWILGLKLIQRTQFETCIYNKADNQDVTISSIMSCNAGNTLEMKKCLVEDAYAGVRWINISQAVACWEKTH